MTVGSNRLETRVAELTERLQPQIDAVRAAWGETGEAEVETGLAYGDGDPVRIRIRKRGRRYDLSDAGVAVGKVRDRPRRWLELAERVVAEEGLNVNRRGTVFVPATEGRDLARLAARLAETSLAVYGALLDADEDRV